MKDMRFLFLLFGPLAILGEAPTFVSLYLVFDCACCMIGRKWNQPLSMVMGLRQVI